MSAGVDYVTLATTARRLVNANGKPAVFNQFEATPSNASRPWRGNDTPRNPPSGVVNGDAVSVPPSSATQLGIATEDDDFVKRADAILIAVTDEGSEDIDNFDEVVLEGVSWAINGVQKLRPATVTLVYFVSVRR